MSWLPKKVVVVPVDFSDGSVQAIEVALEHVAEPQNVHVVHVLTAMNLLSPDMAWIAPDDETRGAAMRKHLDEFLQQRNLTTVTAALKNGEPGLSIVDYANEHNAELIIISSHGYHGVKRLLLGSVAERILRHAHCPTLVLRRSDAG